MVGSAALDVPRLIGFLSFLIGAVLTGATADLPTAWATPAKAAESGAQLLVRFECSRCHDGGGLPAATLEKHCTHCHQQIAAGTFAAAPELLAEWRRNLISLPAVPSLVATGGRLRRDWVFDFLRRPHDLRPALLAMMPRLPLTTAQARLIAATLVPSQLPDSAHRPTAPDLLIGRQLLDSLGCGSCHQFSGVAPLAPGPLPSGLPVARLSEAIALAPDLRYTRQRFQPAALGPWLRDPAALKPDTLMPKPAVDARAAQQLADYILYAPLAAQPLPPLPPRLPLLRRRVSFAEVNAQVFRRTCWHCHSTPEYAMGDGGPGNTGGFGFRGRRLNVSTYADLASGSVDDRGERRSVFLPGPDGQPRLLSVLLARQKELRGGEVAGVTGMPLGLPALTAEQIQLVESFIAQGRPQ